ncbi:hypothetical protein F5B22DRAFT_652397 [Xylaria bambusicola]|uniref:uncharacterized protein n=1 Tax=Xylaria bambusicola TaxID=326684 RepID=UPI002007BF36|nr:uncharacterized protein F5B22DRAFT_652397 [Xylaria bambusicola]KAI0503086.1 hypothetical protein F5B22DRAFT_652397 [Xylaria bambusicola]
MEDRTDNAMPISSPMVSWHSSSLPPHGHRSIPDFGTTQSSSNSNLVNDISNEIPHVPVLDEITEDTQAAKLCPAEKVDKSRAPPQFLIPESWKPAYLAKRRLVMFPIIFLVFVITIQILIQISQSNDGLAKSTRNLHYLWTFGPMAVLILLAAAWGRVEFQAKSVAPWAHLMEGGQADKTLFLDYLSMLQPIAVVRAVKFRDWVVASATLCSLILRVAVVFSTALIVLLPTEILDANVPVALRSSFVDNATELGDLATRIGTLPYYSMRGLSTKNMAFPDGTWNNYAYQQFAVPDVSDARLNVTVDGFTSSLSCEPVSLNISYSSCDELSWRGYCWALEAQDCQYPIQRILVQNLPELDNIHDAPPSYYGQVGLTGCDNSTKIQDVRMYMLFGKLGPNNGTVPADYTTIWQSSQIVCRASYAIDRVDVISNHTEVLSVSNATITAPRHIEELEEGRMLDLYLESFETATSTESMRVTVPLLGETGEPEDADLDLYFADALMFSLASNSSVSDLFQQSLLEEIISRHYQQTTAFIAKSVFSKQTAGGTMGTMWLKKDRLLVSAATGHTMTALLSVAAILSLIVIFTKPGITSLPKNPNSVVETAQLLTASKDVKSLLSGAGPASLGTVKNRLRDFQFRATAITDCATELLRISASINQEPHELHYLNAPAKTMRTSLVLNPISMVAVQVLIIGTIVALEVILRVSGDENDFVDVLDGKYIHFTWTILPALFMSLISMYFAAVDLEIRSLTPYSKLSKGSSLAHMIHLDLLDGSTPRLLWREHRSDSLAALATTFCTLTASFLTIFVGSLYTTVDLPTDLPVRLLMETSFNVTRQVVAETTDLGQLPDFSSLTSTLILESNLSYPAFTYETLAFPEFSMLDMEQSHQISSSDVVHATLPALRSKMSCTRYSASEIQMEVISASIPGVPASHEATRVVLAIDIDGEQHQSFSIPNGLTHNVEVPLDNGADWVFGFGDSCNGHTGLLWCTSDFLYVWGHKTNSTTQSGNHVAALTCNESIEAVDAFTTFVGPQLSIDPSFPPRPIDDSARRSTVKVHSSIEWQEDDWESPYIYLAQGVAAPGTYLWPFFDALITSRYAISLGDLDDPHQDAAVASAIVAQHGILRAQVLNEGFRGPANATNATLVNPPANIDRANDAIVYDGTLRRSFGRRRLAQDPATTRVLEALLVATLVLSAAGRLLMRNTKLLPRNPTSIANVAAIVADGNLDSILPENTQLLSDDEFLAKIGGGYLLRLGWCVRKGRR